MEIGNDSQPNPAPEFSTLEIPRWKRVLDIALILLALPVLFPVMLGIALFVRCVSAGPVLFRQERVGHRGSRFRCFKFRTMHVGNNTAVHQGHLTRLMDSNAPMVKMDAHGDPRIIPFGVPLRSSGLDELPQIFNVLMGDMSLVGPRPCVPYEFDKYLAWQKERFNVLPGLTGLWQVSGKNNTTFEEMMRLDIHYSRKSNLWLDIKIIFKTIPALIVQMLETRARRRAAENTAHTEQAEQKSARPVPARTFKPIIDTD
ncbi:MAG TPA: sugar transferase [Verrucomicrobiae bacterium]|jgi:lipopolysaccharide/colanic/teichoic acid biosynthesis glycosyltransferase|nr:sugar transferase [Verrucomicrobiae bacterium]